MTNHEWNDEIDKADDSTHEDQLRKDFWLKFFVTGICVMTVMFVMIAV